ncbi:MAG: hypothetical protein GXO43_01490 [Crenarchaeota archaeon]|nr:hypothetical protein [Thermoproteota archaeon]
MIRRLIAFLAVFVIFMVLVEPVYPAVSSLDYVWGRFPSNIRIVGVKDLSKDDNLENGDWFQIVYEIKVSKLFYQGEDYVKQQVVQHFEKFLGKIIREHPELRIYYAEYKCYKVDGNPIVQNYYYHVRIIGHVEPITLSNGTKKLIGWVGVAVIIALILACIIASIVLVQQPAVQKLLVSVGEAIHSVASNMFTMLVLLPIVLLMLIVLVLLLGRKT